MFVFTSVLEVPIFTLIIILDNIENNMHSFKHNRFGQFNTIIWIFLLHYYVENFDS